MNLLTFTVLPTLDDDSSQCTDSSQWPLSIHIVFDLPAKPGAFSLDTRVGLLKRLAEYVDIEPDKIAWSAEPDPLPARELENDATVVVADSGNVPRVRQHNRPAVRLSWPVDGCDLFTANNKELVRFVQDAARDGSMSRFLGRLVLNRNEKQLMQAAPASASSVGADILSWYVKSSKPIPRLKRQVSSKNYDFAAPNYFNRGGRAWDRGRERGSGDGGFSNDIEGSGAGNSADYGGAASSRFVPAVVVPSQTMRLPTTTTITTIVAVTTTTKVRPTTTSVVLPPPVIVTTTTSQWNSDAELGQRTTRKPPIAATTATTTAYSNTPLATTDTTKQATTTIRRLPDAPPNARVPTLRPLPALPPPPTTTTTSTSTEQSPVQLMKSPPQTTTVRTVELLPQTAYVGRHFDFELEKSDVAPEAPIANAVVYSIFSASTVHGDADDFEQRPPPARVTWLSVEQPLRGEHFARFTGLPLAAQAGTNRLLIETRDGLTDALVGRARIDIEVQRWLDQNRPPMLATTTLRDGVHSSCGQFASDAKTQTSFINKLAAYIGAQPSNIVVTGVAWGSTHVEWTNAALTQDKCPITVIKELQRALMHNAEAFQRHMQPFVVEKTVVNETGECIATMHNVETGLQRVEPRGGDDDDDSTSSGEVLAAILVAIGIVSLILLAACCVAFFLYRRNKHGKASYSTSGYGNGNAAGGINGGIAGGISDRTSFSKKTMQPIIFPEEISDPKSSSAASGTSTGGDGSSFSTPTPPGHRPTTIDSSTTTTTTTNRTPLLSGTERGSTSPRPGDQLPRALSPPYRRNNNGNGGNNGHYQFGTPPGGIPRTALVANTMMISESTMTTTTNGNGIVQHHELDELHLPLLLKPQHQQPSTMRQTPSASPP